MTAGETAPTIMTADELRGMLDRDWQVTVHAARYLTVWAPGVAVTIDARARCWRAGGQVTHGDTVHGVSYKGRGWKRRLVDDVVTWIDKVLKEA